MIRVFLRHRLGALTWFEDDASLPLIRDIPGILWIERVEQIR